jgi:hypothetical protein
MVRFGLHFNIYEGLSSSALACFPHYLRVPASGYTLSVVLVLEHPISLPLLGHLQFHPRPPFSLVVRVATNAVNGRP